MTMKLSQVRALVATGFGINCEEEAAAAFLLAGADAQIVHLNELFDGRVSIHDFDIFNLPGGFSFGDDLGSGKVLANKLKYKRMKSGKRFLDELLKFLGDGKFILGVCNGFQALVKTGLLPNVGGKLEQEVTLTHNESGKFEDRWCHCAVSQGSITPFLEEIDCIDLPVRHGEGKLIVRDDQVRESILLHSLNCLSYSDEEGRVTEKYPMNPNGSQLNCAGMTDRTGQILGLMPHPEAYLSFFNHPNWGREARDNENHTQEGEGLKLFRNIVQHVVGGKHHSTNHDVRS